MNNWSNFLYCDVLAILLLSYSSLLWWWTNRSTQRYSLSLKSITLHDPIWQWWRRTRLLSCYSSLEQIEANEAILLFRCPFLRKILLYNVTLACDDDEHIELLKVILLTWIPFLQKNLFDNVKEEQEFFDIALACHDENMEIHKVILLLA